MIKVEFHQFFAPFSPANRELLLAATEHRIYAPSEQIFEEGDPSDALYLVLSGEVELRKQTEDGQEVLARLGGDECFGEMGVLDGRERSAAAYAVSDTRLARIPAPTLLDIISREPSSTIIKMFHSVSERLRRTDNDYIAETFSSDRFRQLQATSASFLRAMHPHLDAIRQEYGSDSPAYRQACLMLQTAQLLGAYPEDTATEQTSAEAILQELAELNHAYLANRAVELEIKCGAEQINSDRNLLLCALQKLLNNAVEAGAKKITVSSYWQPSLLEISMQDNGYGVDPAIRDTLFAAFITAGKAPSIGMGLATAKSIIEKLGGSITYLANKSGGSTFIITIKTASES